MRSIHFVWFVALLPSMASASFQMSARDSRVSFSWLAGYANEIYSGGASDMDGNLFAIDGVSLKGSDSASGYYAPTNVKWTAAFSWEITHSYLVEGNGASALNSATKITASGATLTNSNVPAPASGTLSSKDPGNTLTLEFINPYEQQFLFWGNLQQSGPVNRNRSSIILYKEDLGGAFVPFNVQDVQNSSFSQLLTLPGGIYSIVATSVSEASIYESRGATWDYWFEVATPVPEPEAYALMLAGLGLVGLMARRRVC